MLGDTVVLMIVGNKVDLSRNRNVECEEAFEWALFAIQMLILSVELYCVGFYF